MKPNNCNPFLSKGDDNIHDDYQELLFQSQEEFDFVDKNCKVFGRPETLEIVYYWTKARADKGAMVPQAVTVDASMELFSFISIYLLVFLFKMSTALDTITPSQSMSDGKTLISQDGSFELGFFSAGISKNRYLGIWYKNIPVRTIVWVANRSSPINDSSGLLMIDISGNLLILSGNKTVVWSSESSKEAQSPILQLLDSGNLVLRDEKESDPGIYLWQSFDYPSDTLLPGMKLGVNLKTGLDRRLTSWKSWDDPSPGDFFWKIQIHNNPESTMWKGSRIFFRTGPWNGITYSGTPQLKPNPIFYFNFVHNEDEVYYTFGLKKKSIISRLVMNQTNNRRDRYTWDEAAQSWSLYT
ncbi:hypothetical protein GH714_008731 [Hevea brasiliensis]|uniref:Bulb-type lectin domain-containing protein n=1 Tax=Hevea brasiliensis TaxID=3981 RepID=A0A6A6KAN7_HEVBR|nr:hypothetical protein GH714_008731 [Hevea brasiliensis]